MLRQAALRPSRPRGRRAGARPSRRRRRVPAASRPLCREPRRAARGGDVPRAEGPRSRRGDAEPDRRAARPRGQLDGRTVQLPSSWAVGPTSWSTRACGRSTSAPRVPRRRRLPGGRVGACRARRMGRQRELGAVGRLGLARNVAQARRRQPGRRPGRGQRLAPVGRPARRDLASRDAAGGGTYERRGDDLRDGMYVALPPWGFHLFDLAPADPGQAE